jgi:hypothetical protein
VKRDLATRMAGLTQRLDHTVPDPKMSAAENAAAAAELRSLSAHLFELLPDKSLSPLERIERFSRAVDREPDLDQLKSANEKLAELKGRIDALVPGEMSAHDKLLVLENALNEKAGIHRAAIPTVEKLEVFGDPRGKIEPV